MKYLSWHHVYFRVTKRMMLTKRQGSLAISMILVIGLIGLTGLLFLKSEIGRRETRFSERVKDIAGAIRNKLDTNEAVLAGFSAFLQAVDQSDTTAAKRYAAVVFSAYPHIYMLEVARRVPISEQAAFETQLRRTWRSDFKFKDFSRLTRQSPQPVTKLDETWPVLFMYPTLPQASAIYGVRLETVGYLSRTLAQVNKSSMPLASPVFTMYEGGQAYILMQSVNKTIHARSSSRPNFFGNTMVALLLIKTESLLEAVHQVNDDPLIRTSATLKFITAPESRIFTKEPEPAGMLDRLLLPLLTARVEVRNASQPMTLLFERQLRLGDILTTGTLMMLAVLSGALVLTPFVLLRHFQAIEQTEIEHRRSAYLATHDVLTKLPNRYLFAEHFDQALSNWQRKRVPFAVMLIDLDHFKVINDQGGHEVGDQVLCTVADRMLEETRSCDTVARYGGDEFVVLILDVTDLEDARTVGKKILQSVRRPIPTSQGERSVSCSIGISLFPADGQSLDTLLKLADRTMYGVKQRGREGIAMHIDTG